MMESHFPENSSALLVEISKHLLQSQHGIWLRLKGNCMWPVVRNADEIKIQKSSFQDLRFGDVAIYQTTPQTFHANILFRRPKVNECTPADFFGRVTEIRRSGKTIDLETRGFMRRFFQTVIAPANPYGIGFPAFVVKKISGKR